MCATFDVDSRADWPSPQALPNWASRPAAAVALALAIGIALELEISTSIWICLAGLAAAVLLAIFARRQSCPTLEAVALLLGLVFAGGGLVRLQYSHYKADEIGLLASDEPQLIRLTARITQSPQVIRSAPGDARSYPPRQEIFADAISLPGISSSRPTSGTVRIQLDEPNPALAEGQVIRLIGMLRRPAVAMNPGEYDPRASGRQQRLLAEVHVGNAGSVQVVSDQSQSIITHLRLWTRKMLDLGTDDLEFVDRAITRALLLGDRDSILRPVREEFAVTGTSHHMAISGMHVAVLGMFVLLIFRSIGLRPAASVLMMVGFVILYGLATTTSPSVVRAVLMCLGASAVMILRRRVDTIQLFSMVTLCILLYSPMDLQSPGFQLSFGTVLGLMLLVKPALEYLSSRETALGRRTTEHPHPVFHRGIHRVVRGFRTSLVTGTIAWIVATPLVVIHFHRLCPWTIPNSLLMGPLVVLGLIGSMLKMVFSALLPSGSGIWTSLFLWPIPLLRQLVHSLAQLPGGGLAVSPPPTWFAAIYYGVICLPLLTIFRRDSSSQPATASRFSPSQLQRLMGLRWVQFFRARMGILPVILGIFLLPTMLGMRLIPTGSDQVRVTVLAVGEGSCSVIELPDGQVVMVDAGSLSRADVARSVVAPFLRYKGIQKIDTLVITTCEYAHYGTAGWMINEYRIVQVIIADGFEQAAKKNYTARKLLEDLRSNGIPIRPASAGQKIFLSSQTSLDVFWPQPATSTYPPAVSRDPSNHSDQSIPSPGTLSFVLRHGSAGMLFPGNLEDAALAQLSGPANVPRGTFASAIQVALVPNHGKLSPPLLGWMKEIGATQWICQDDARPRRGQKTFADQTQQWPIWHTAKVGAVDVRLILDGTVTTENFATLGNHMLDDADESAREPAELSGELIPTE